MNLTLTNKIILNKKKLIKEYIRDKKSTVQLAKEFKCSRTTIRRNMVDYNIKRRTISEATKLAMTDEIKKYLSSFHKGKHNSLRTEFKRGERKYPEAGFQKGVRYSPETEFKKGHITKTKGRKNAKHHIYLKENSHIMIKMAYNKHTKLHYQAYRYLYEKYGKKGINNYLKWFDKKYGLDLTKGECYGR